MSYSFNVRAPSKAEVLEKAKAEFDKIVTNQPIHEADRPHVEAAIEAFLGLMDAPPEDHDLSLNVNGSVYYSPGRAEGDFAGVSLGIQCGFLAQPGK